MGKPTGFLEIERRDRDAAPVRERVKTIVWMLFCNSLPASSLAVSRELARNPSCLFTTGGL